MTETITRLYDNYSDAANAVRELERAGVPHSDISIVASNADDRYSMQGDRIVDRDMDGRDDRAEGAAAGAGVGAAIGGIAGALAGLGLLAIPGVGPVVAAGWLVSTIAGAAAGGATGGVIGALTQAGVSTEDAHVYAEGVRRGGTLVTARVNDSQRQSLQAVLDRSAVNIATRRAAYQKGGWTSFDEHAPPYTADQVKIEREMYRR
ncbi:MAG TPA: hypothetical protein VFC26_14890 [Verrucomicrobiae bacterium]|nr:hypothetical protein [Verrucomicrobiae bacterium]